MRKQDWTVTDESIRPVTKAAGKDECTYCGASRGSQHEPDCVCRQRTVVIQATFEYVITMPESWTPEQIEAHRNESSWCAKNAVMELNAIENCLCNHSDFTFIREATAEDEHEFSVFAANIKA